ncbi:MAG: hypothetical protein ABFC98_01805, partial [Candidatus Cloacimonas sp.]
MPYHNSDLEFETLISQLSSHCQSALGKSQCSNLQPLADLAAIKKSQTLISEIQEQLLQGVDYDFSGLTNLVPLFEDSRNSLFGFEEFAAVYANNLISEQILSHPEIWDDYPETAKYIKKLTSFASLNARF